MQISRDSWHYKLMCGMFSEWTIPERFCPYMRKLIFGVICMTVLAFFALVALGNFFWTIYGWVTVGLEAFKHDHPGSFISFIMVSVALATSLILLVVMPTIGWFSDRSVAKRRELHEQMEEEFAGVWEKIRQDWIDAGADWAYRPQYHIERQSYFGKLQKKPNIFFEYCRALHNKVCPTVDFVDGKKE